VTWDDPNYLRAFEGVNLNTPDWYHWLIEEPGWALLTTALSPLGPDAAYRVVLFASPLAFVLSANKIAGGRWLAVGVHSWLILAALVLVSSLGTAMYVGAIRQGVATSLFLLLVANRLPPVVSALLAGTVHSCMLVVAAVVALAQAVGRDRRLAVLLALGFGLYAVLLGLHLAPSPFAGADLGRRSDTYTGSTGLNLLGYAAFVLQIGGPLWLAREVKSPWHTASLVFLAAAAALSAANPGFIRIGLTLSAFVLLTLTGVRTRRGWMAVVLWLGLSVALALWNGRDDMTGRDSWLGLWGLVLNR
jgi:hypothetical protein